MDDSYESIRQNNIREKENFLNSLKAACPSAFEALAPSPKPKPVRTPIKNGSDRLFRGGFKFPTIRMKLRTRSSKDVSFNGEEESSDSDSSDEDRKVEFPLVNKDSIVVEDFDDAVLQLSPVRKRGRRPGGYDVIPKAFNDPSEVTEYHLKRVALRVCDKAYSGSGTTCHQCRQKTNDVKTVCWSQDCAGTRGQFCGPCLFNRYGEDIREALKNPDWRCPPCRLICNCSFCRNRDGKRCTGILIHEARNKGFNSVSEYLLTYD